MPDEKEWSIILSSANSDWGSFFYNQEFDVIRVNVNPLKNNNYDHWLNYYFDNPQYDQIDLVMVFGEIKLNLPIKVNVNEIVLNSLRKELQGVSLANPAAYNQAAQFCLTHNVNLEEGLKWSQRASRNNKSFTNLLTESGLHRKLDDVEKAEKLKDEAFNAAQAGDLVNYGFQIMGPKMDKNRSEALEAFKKAREIKPEAAFPMFAMGKYYQSYPDRSRADIKLAIKFYKMAKETTSIEGLKRSMDQQISLLNQELK